MAYSKNDTIWLTFVVEARQNIDVVESVLLRLESATDTAPGQSDEAAIHQLYRALHTLKGNARFMGLSGFERIAHLAENIVGIARESGKALVASGFDVLLRSVDHLRDHLSGLERGHSPESLCDAKHHTLLNDLQQSGEEWCRAVGQVPANAAPSSLEFELFDDDEVLEPSAPVDRAVPIATIPIEASVDHAANKPRSTPSSRSSTDEFLRVPSAKVQHLLELAGEIGLAIGAVTLDQAVVAIDGMADKTMRLQSLVRELREASSSLALVPINDMFSRAKRLIRDLAQSTGKELELTLEGEDTEVDKTLVDRLFEPLMHMIRNCADHGIESAAQRIAAGKPSRGTIRLRAAQRGGEIVLAVCDDGKGLSREKILQRARQIGLEASDDLSDEAVWAFIFRPGFSTAEKVTDLSGRGVGMDVVREVVHSLRGRVTMTSRVGQGTEMTMRFPLTLAFCDAILVQVDGRTYALALETVVKICQASTVQHTFVHSTKQHFVVVDDSTLPMLWLQDFYRTSKMRSHQLLPQSSIVIVRAEQGHLAVPVDAVLGAEQVTMKPIRGLTIRAASGYGLLPSGDVAVALDCEKLYACI